MFDDPTARAAQGLFLSPFKAQAQAIASLFASWGMSTWSASTVHSQQGSEANIVLFDSVNAGSYGWPYDEWKRLVNVALSRSRESIIVLASGDEMDEPYLRPLQRQLHPRVLRRRGQRLAWEAAQAAIAYSPPVSRPKSETATLGDQLSQRKSLRPVLSSEQERLCRLQLDGRPRLVGGVAGSGKTVVLAHWLMQTVKRLGDRPNVRIWAVFANRSLQSLIANSIESAWRHASDGKPFPWDRVMLHHVREILAVLFPEAGLSMAHYAFEYDEAAAAYLARNPAARVAPRCDAMFIDEAQDMGPHTLHVLSAIVRQTDDEDGNSRSVNIFYDNAQNIYRRRTPTWSDLGFDMRGRSTVMKESFRSTKPIAEFALNVLYRLQPTADNRNHNELVARGLIEKTSRPHGDWWTVRFNQIDGPKPSLRQYVDIGQEFAAIADYCRALMETERVDPGDIGLIYNGAQIKQRLETQLASALRAIGVELSVQTNRPFQRSRNTLLATTSHSFKGCDAEVVIVPAVDHFAASDVGILSSNLYVAMTRARSILTLFAQRINDPDANKLYRVLATCLDDLHERPSIEHEISPQDDLADVLSLICQEHWRWFEDLWNRYPVSYEPLLTHDGQVIAEPLFSLKVRSKRYACMGREGTPQRVVQRPQDCGVSLLEVGQTLSDEPSSGDWLF